MTRAWKGAAAAALVAMVAAGTRVSADVKTEEKGLVKFEGTLGRMVNLFGGKGAREGLVSQVAVQGDRKMTMAGQNGQIVDLREEKVYDLDMKKKTYTMTTFEELRRRMREAQERAEKESKEEATRGEPQKQEAPDKPEKEMEVDFSVKETGQKKTIAGYEAREVVMTVTVREKGRALEESGGLVATANTWLGPRIAAMKEIADFELRYAKKLEGPWAAGASAEQMAAALALYPMLKPALGKIQTENVNMDGTALETVTVLEAVKSKEQLDAEAADAQQQAQSGGLGGMLARKLMKRKEEPKARAAFMTITHEVITVSTDVAAADLAIPAGFKERQ
jgi:hypothetical protein